MPPLTRDQILWAAIRIADEQGPDAVTLRRISSELGVHVTSLYNHVPTRDAITDGMLEVLLTEAKLPTRPVSWEEWARRFFAAISDIATTHSGAFYVLQQRPVQGARATASFEIAIAAFVQAGLSTPDAYAAVKTVVLLATSVGREQSHSARGEDRETRLDDLPADAFPLVRSVAVTARPEDSWAFAIETVIAGLRTRIEQ
ncbi:TetR family transcriptional regulator [Cryptosporangium sp. NPDC048952]|uniref:TetR family transcriptional regulator n=1 Tax=Cryptosporangium sp. NPDC048952 TaxID=3363961 RepID=UPI0037200422